MTDPPQPSNVLTYVVITLVAVGAVGFLFLLFGPLFLVALAPFGLLVGLGAVHYFLWGRALSAGSDGNAEARPGPDDPAG
jgi:hypothetical protein